MISGRMIDFPSMNWRNPLAEMERMTRQMDRLTNEVFGRTGRSLFSPKVFPAVNITEDKDKYYVRAELPGIKAEDLILEIQGKNLVMSGERKIKAEGDKSRYHRRERDDGRFSRVIGLPGDVRMENVDANMVNGILTVVIEKSEASKPRKIMVK